MKSTIFLLLLLLVKSNAQIQQPPVQMAAPQQYYNMNPINAASMHQQEYQHEVVLPNPYEAYEKSRENVNSLAPTNQLEPTNLKSDSIIKPKTVYDEAVAYWTENQCDYPPKDFYHIFYYSCNVFLDNIEFTSGLCYAFFNSSKHFCNVKSDEEEKKTLQSITSMQETVENDEICDTLMSLKQENTELFPFPTGENKWFKRAYDIIFSDSCKYACGIKGAHPICFGYFLNYELISEKKSDVKENEIQNEVEKIEEDLNPVTSEVSEDVKTSPTLEDKSNVETKINGTSKIYRPNPKLLLDQKFAGPDDYYYTFDETILNDDAGGIDYMQDEEAFNGLVDESTDANKETQEVDFLSKNQAGQVVQADLFKELDVLDLPEKVKDQETELLDINSPLYEDVYYASLTGKDESKLNEKELELINKDYSEERWMPFGSVTNVTSETLILNFLFLGVGIIVLLALYLLFRASRRGYIRRLRLGRGRNWNYERVQTLQPDPEEFYE